ncbi:MAG: transcriptional repressor LexA [Alphaproteobacteria bacterium]|nr:transcriptional repressor LexA [Alphaproteobacteria bacterium]
MDDLTPRQREVLEFILAWNDQHGISPSFREIGDHLGIRSTNGVSDHVRTLERKGYLERVGDPGAARSLRVSRRARTSLEDQQVVGIPVLGRIAAGQPILAEEDHDSTLMLDRGLVPAGGEIFGLVVKGDSMIEDGIFDGDYVFVRRQPTCRDGEIAAVLVDGEATVKRPYHERGRLRLQPSNAAMSPIWVGQDVAECEIMGVVVGVYRRL